MTTLVNLKYLGICPYSEILQQMQNFTKNRNQDTIDEIWLLGHYPVFTQGQAGKPQHILDPKNIDNNIKIIQSDRGGQITYHGPGQIVAYVLLNLNKHKLGVRSLISKLEQSMLDLLDQEYSIKANTRAKAPGVYIKQDKIGSVGLRISKGCSYHGLSLNINMDLSPFKQINPCGYANLKITQLMDHIIKKQDKHDISTTKVMKQLAIYLLKHLELNNPLNNANILSI